MDKEQEQLEFFGFIGVLKESLKIILSHPKIFTKISLAFILPLTFISLLNNEISKLLSNKITHHSSHMNSSSKWVLYWGFEAVYFTLIFVIILTLLSISAVVYTAACIYSGKEITIKQVMRAIPKVWKRLMITLISNFCIIFVYTIVILLCALLIIHGFSLKKGDARVGLTIITSIAIILLSVGVIYLTIFWQLANVISVMENRCGFGAMKKSKELIKGQFGTAIAIMLVQGLCYLPIILLNRQLLVKDSDIGIGLKILFAILILVLNPLQTLYSLVVQTVFYCVCKSYHHESINKSTLSDHLEELLGDHVPLVTESVEIV